MIIDAHVHLWGGSPGKKWLPRRHNWYVAMYWAYGGKPPYTKDPKELAEKLEFRFSDPEGRYTIQTMDTAGVDASVLLALNEDAGWGEGSPVSLDERHRLYGELQNKYPGRLIPVAYSDPRDVNALETFDRAIKEYGLKGLCLIPDEGYFAWDEQVYPFYDRCTDYGLPVFICSMAHSGGYMRGFRYNEPLNLSDVIADFPDMTLLIKHAGWPFQHWFEECLVLAGRAINTYLIFDMWITGHMQQPALPSILNNEEATVRLLCRARDAIGAHRMLWGTDSMWGPTFHGSRALFPMSLKDVVDWCKRLPATAAKYGLNFPKEDVDLFLGDNAARVMGISKPPEWEIPNKYGWRRRYPGPYRR